MNEFITPLVTVLMGIIGVAIIATLVSKNSDTAKVVNAGGNAFSGALNAALMPITGIGYTNTKF